MTVTYTWRGEFESAEVRVLHANAFESTTADNQVDWRSAVEGHSLGWVTARIDPRLVGFVNVIWDGMSHAWVQDLMVSSESRRTGVGTKLVIDARDGSKPAGCEWLHVDFEQELKGFYVDACGFSSTDAGLIRLRGPLA